MTLAYIVSEYPHPQVKHAAGIGTSVKNLAVALAKKGIKVIVFVYHQDTDAVVYDEGVEIHIIKHKTYQFFGWYLYRKHINSYINKVIEEKSIDAIEAPDWTGITAFMDFKIPLFIRFHGSDAYFCKLDGRKQKLKNYWFEKLALKKAKAFIAPTSYAGEVSKEIFSLDANKIKTIHYGLELSNFENPNPEKYTKNLILYVGTIIRKKGVLELAEIFNKVIEKVPKSELVLIGADAPDLKTGNASTYNVMSSLFSESAKKQVKYLGKIPYSEVMQHIIDAHVCVFPSFAETLGMVTIESMALQKPVVNTSIGWAQELIESEKEGLLVHPSDIDTYAESILKLLGDEALCLSFGKNARLKVEKSFDINKNADINIDYYKSFLN